jgi:hypothetical protein
VGVMILTAAWNAILLVYLMPIVISSLVLCVLVYLITARPQGAFDCYSMSDEIPYVSVTTKLTAIFFAS